MNKGTVVNRGKVRSPNLSRLAPGGLTRTPPSQSGEVKRAQKWLVGLALLAVTGSGCDLHIYEQTAIPAPPAESYPFELEGGRHLRSWSGDRFEMEHDDRVHFILLEGVWAPDKDQPGFARSRSFLTRQIRGKPFKVVVSGRDEANREIGRVYVEGQDINIELLRTGWLKLTRPPPDAEAAYRTAEAEARGARKGLWSERMDAPPNHPSQGSRTGRSGPSQNAVPADRNERDQSGPPAVESQQKSRR